MGGGVLWSLGSFNGEYAQKPSVRISRGGWRHQLFYSCLCSHQQVIAFLKHFCCVILAALGCITVRLLSGQCLITWNWYSKSLAVSRRPVAKNGSSMGCVGRLSPTVRSEEACLLVRPVLNNPNQSCFVESALVRTFSHHHSSVWLRCGWALQGMQYPCGPQQRCTSALPNWSDIPEQMPSIPTWPRG